MKGLRLLNNGRWNKDPALMAARSLLVQGLAPHFLSGPLGSMATFVNGTSYDASQVSEIGRYPIIRISNISDPSAPYTRTNEQLPERFWVRRGDLLVSWSASFKSALWSGREGFLNQHIFKVCEREGHSRSFIRHVIEASFDDMQDNVVGIGMMHLRRVDFLGHDVPMPPLDVQQQVAAFLDWLERGQTGPEPNLPEVLHGQRRMVARIEEVAGKVEEARRLRDQASQQARQVLSAAEFSVWPESALEDAHPLHCLTTFLARGRQSEQGDSDHVLVKTQHVQQGRYVPTHMHLAPHVAAKVSSEALLKEGDILVACSAAGCLGRVARFKGDGRPASTDTHVAIVRPNPEIVDPDYLYAYLLGARGQVQLRSRERGDWQREKVGFRLTELNLKDLREVPVPVPEKHEQVRIVAELRQLREVLDSAATMQATTRAELDALLPAVLDRSLKGEL